MVGMTGYRKDVLNTPCSPSSTLTGAKSTENLLTSADSPRSLHRQGDGDSVSSGSNSAHNPEWPSRPGMDLSTAILFSPLPNCK